MSNCKVFGSLLRIYRVNTRLITRVHRIPRRNLTESVCGSSCIQPFSRLDQASYFHTNLRRLAFDEVETREEFCITYSDLKNGVDNDRVLVIDVRRPGEVDAGHIPAKRFLHIPVQDIAEAFQMSDDEFKEKYGTEKPSKEASDIVFHCKLGGRSTFALRIAQNLGYAKAKHYPGGWAEWSENSP